MGLSVTWTAGMTLAGRGAELDSGGLLCAGIALAVLAFLGTVAGGAAWIVALCRKRDSEVKAISDGYRAELSCVTDLVAVIGQRAGHEPGHLAEVIQLHQHRAS